MMRFVVLLLIEKLLQLVWLLQPLDQKYVSQHLLVMVRLLLVAVYPFLLQLVF